MGSAAGPRELLDELLPHIADPRVLDAVLSVPRASFVSARLRDQAWLNRPLPIGEGQTISQPLVVARMCELLALDGRELVLDVGTGSGYHAAILARLARRVVSIERRPRLLRRAAAALSAVGVTNVTLVLGDGSRGHPAQAPYDAINVAAASAGGVPSALEAQLGVGGRLVVPVEAERQRLVLVRRTPGGYERRTLDEVQFVPLISHEEAAAIQAIVDLVE